MTTETKPKAKRPPIPLIVPLKGSFTKTCPDRLADWVPGLVPGPG